MKKSTCRALMTAVAMTPFLLSGCGVTKPAPTPAPAPAAPPVRVEPPPKTQWVATASALQEEIYPAAYACDGKRETRWSSPASDPQWLQIDFGREATVCGLTILWEDAYSSEYSILVSPDGAAWTEVYSMHSGDGKTDEIYFQPVNTRYVKIQGTKRGTGWGHSIWEVDVKGPAEQIRVEGAGQSGSGPERLFDGKLENSWISAGSGPATVSVDLRREKELGGIRIDWGENYGKDFALFTSRDGSAWTRQGEIKDGTGRFDLVLHPKATARYLRLDLLAAAEAGRPMEIKEITLRGPDEVMSPLTTYQIAAEKSRPGLYPDFLHKRQVYWTLVGMPGDMEESLIDEYGNIEPKGNSSTISPFIYVDDRLLSAFDATEVTQSLADDYLPLPAVDWKLKDLGFKVQAFAQGAVDQSVTYVAYTLSNTSSRPQQGRLFLAIRPLQVNPPWQFGGLSPIRSMGLREEALGTVVQVNGENLYVALSKPAAFGTRAFERGDVIEDLARGRVPGAKQLQNAGDYISGVLAYDFNLQPGGQTNVVVAVPLHNRTDNLIPFAKMGQFEEYAPAEAFKVRLEESKHFWHEQLDKVVVRLPDRAVENTIRSQIAYILINRDGVSIQPGSRNYNRSWIRDGSLTSVAMLRMGLVEPVREFIDWYARSVQPDGLVPPILNNDGTVNGGFGSNLEYDSQGEFIYLVMEYYRLTGDRTILEKYFNQIHLAMRFMAKLREKTLAPGYMKDLPVPERFAGILPPSFSHEGYSPPAHSYWDDFFALKGWKDGREAAELLGRTDVAGWAGEQYQLLRDSLKQSIKKTAEFKKVVDFPPASADKGDMDVTSTTIAFYPCQEQDVYEEALLQKGYEKYFNEVMDRKKPGWSAGYTPYEVRNVPALVDLGHKDRAIALLDYLNSCRRPPAWNHLAEVVLGDPRMGSYIGDMPHTWVGSGYMNAIRVLLIREQGDQLQLLRGVPESWVRDGQGILLERMPTHFGALNLKAKADGKKLTIDLSANFRTLPSGIELSWPLQGKPARVTVDGAEWTDYDATGCRLAALPRQIVAEW